MQVKKPQGLSITSFLGSTPKDGGIIGLGLGLAALSANAQAVVFKVTETVCSALDEFHLPVEAFGDAFIFREAPHRSDGFGPFLDGMSEGLQGSQLAPLQAADKVQQAVGVCAALSFCLSLLIEQEAELVTQGQRDYQSRMIGDETTSPLDLFRGESLRWSTQASEQSAVTGDLWSNGANQVHEVGID